MGEGVGVGVGVGAGVGVGVGVGVGIIRASAAGELNMNMPVAAIKKARAMVREVILNDERVWRFGFMFRSAGFLVWLDLEIA